MADPSRRELTDPTQRRAALVRLRELSPDRTIAVIDLVVDAAMSHRDAVLAREILSRLPREQLAPALPPLVRGHLHGADDDAFRRLAELLASLELETELAALVARAATSADPDVREIAADFAC